MWLDLINIIEMPGSRKAFECQLDTELMDFPSVEQFKSAPMARGEVVNTAGLLTLTAEIEADMVCVCDRCGKQFESTKIQEVELTLADNPEDEENPDIYVIEGNGIDVSEILETAFLLDMETKFLCTEDCKGLCEHCGKDLNEGPCDCRKPVDPRLAVLGQLLDIE